MEVTPSSFHNEPGLLKKIFPSGKVEYHLAHSFLLSSLKEAQTPRQEVCVWNTKQKPSPLFPNPTDFLKSSADIWKMLQRAEAGYQVKRSIFKGERHCIRLYEGAFRHELTANLKGRLRNIYASDAVRLPARREQPVASATRHV